MAVVVGAPDVDDPVEAPDGELVPVVGDVGREVGVEAVGPTEHIVLQVQLLDVRLFFAGPPVVVPEDVGGPEPQSPVLLIGPAPRRQQLHRLGHIAALVEGGLIEPVVVADLVPLQVALHLGQVDGQAELGQLLQPLFLGGGEQRVPVLLVIGLRQVPDVLALVAVLRERHRVLPLDQLAVPGVDGVGEFVDLVAGVVHVELPRHVRAAGGEDAGQGVAQHAAPGVAHVHGARGVGGDELHHDLLPLQAISGAVLRALSLHRLADAGIPAVSQAEIQKARPRDLRRGEVAARQIHVVQQSLGDAPGRLAQRLGCRQGKGGSEVAVGGVLGDLHRGGLDLRRRQCAVRHRRLIGGHGQGSRLVLRVLYHVDHVVPSFVNEE